ncbi:MAG TPA: hypothetical protein VG842_00385 [Sediminibacterium sp.]|nr:hypothetical protein [Sediminibacterium sp.]
MLSSSSPRGLHLQYRVWIAELNHDINILRIFDDCIAETKQQQEPAFTHFQEKFMQMRQEIDALRHMMHLHKTNLAHDARKAGPAAESMEPLDDHSTVQKRYERYRADFIQLMTDFSRQIDALYA